MIRIIYVLISIIFSLLLLSVFCLFYSYSGVHITNKNKTTDYTWLPFQFRSVATEGYSYFRMDYNGYNNIYVPHNIDVLIMGSSHMEAANVNKKENTSALLTDKFNVYNIGISGHTIYRCADNLSNAYDYYKPKTIIIETDKVKLEEKEIELVINKKAKPIPSYDSGLIFYLQRFIPCSVNLYNQIDNWHSLDKNLFKSNKITKNNKETELCIDKEYKNSLRNFLLFIKNSIPNDINLIIIYHPKSKINKDGSYQSTINETYSVIFSNECKHLGIDFIDLSYEFENYYNKNRKLPHGFVNTKLGAGHLNRYGHKIFADVLEKELGKYVSE